MPTLAVGGIQGLADFLDALMGGTGLISFSVALGALVWAGFALRPLLAKEQDAGLLVSHSLRWLYLGAFALAASHAVALIAKAFVLKETLGHLPLAAYLGTIQFRAGFARMILSFALGIAARRLLNDPHDPKLWRWILGLMAAVVLSGAWLTHAVGRFERREMLMLFTLIHQAAGAIWFGGVVQLLVLWRTARRHPQLRPLWPWALARFSKLGIAAVAALVLTGVPLALNYVDDFQALLGTGYGSLLLTKAALLALALGFAWINHRSATRWQRGQLDPLLYRTVPHLIEAESFILVSLLFVAATLSSQPPAVDIPQLVASPGEVWQMFKPKWPQLSSPSHAELLIGEAQRATIVGKQPPVAASQWSNFNHNVSGLFLTVMAAVALLGYFRPSRWPHYWPAGFIALAIFLFFRSDAQAWPLGPIGFWESTLGDGEILQHRIATLLAFVLGTLEIRARTQERAHKLRYLFPILCAFGGILLLTHSHAGFELKTEYLIQSTHTVMGLLAVVMAAARWLELKLEPPASRWAGITAMGAMGLIGLILMFYDEPLY
nr:copper resistance protein [uncultured Gammaproteobacteria bacterium]